VPRARRREREEAAGARRVARALVVLVVELGRAVARARGLGVGVAVGDLVRGQRRLVVADAVRAAERDRIARERAVEARDGEALDLGAGVVLLRRHAEPVGALAIEVAAL